MKKMETHPDVKAKVDAQKWFYTSIVKSHFFKPRNFLDGKKVKSYKADGLGLVGSPACIKGETMIRAEQSLFPLQELKVEQKVFSHDGTHNEITKRYCPSYEGEVITLKNQIGNVTLSPDHLVYAMQIPKNSSFAHNSHKRKIPASWVHAKDLETGDICLYPISKQVNKVPSISIIQTKKRYDFKSKGLPAKISLTPLLIRLFGYFIAEGSTRESKSEICFSFGGDEEHLAKEVQNALQNTFNLKSRINKKIKQNKIEVTANNIHLAKYLREYFGKNCYEKRIPSFLLFLEPSLQKELIYGLWQGDGYISFNKKKPRAEFATTSQILAKQLTGLLLRQRISSSLYLESKKIVNGVNHQPCYRIHIEEYLALRKMAALLKVDFTYPNTSRIANHTWFDDNYFYMPMCKIEKKIFQGRLANVEVADAHSYVSDAFALHNCGDMMKVWIKVDKKTDKVKEFKWQTFGCASAIASTSMLSVMVSEKGGMKIEEALKIKPQEIVKRLGDLPARKFHCSVLGDKALRAAINDYFRKSGQSQRIVHEGARVIDKETNVTDKDIEEAVLEGADNFEKVQYKLKVGISNKSCIPEVEQLIRFYKEKYFGS